MRITKQEFCSSVQFLSQVFQKSFRKVITYLVLFSYVHSVLLSNVALATNGIREELDIIELDFKGSQTPQRLHVIPRLSDTKDISHIEIDTKKRLVAVYRTEGQRQQKDEDNQPQKDQDLSSAHLETIKRHPVLVRNHDIHGICWEKLLTADKMLAFLNQHTAWLTPLEEGRYKLAFRGGLLGGGNTGSTGGGGGNSGGGGQCRPHGGTICDSTGRCETHVTICAFPPSNHNSNDHDGSGRSHKSGGSGYSGGSYGRGSIPVFSPKIHIFSSDRRESVALRQQGIVLHYPDHIFTYLKKNAFLPKGYVKDTLLDDGLVQIVVDYNKGLSSSLKIVLEPLAHIVRQDLRNMLSGLEQTRDYLFPLSKSDTLKRLIALSDIHIALASPDTWGDGPGGSQCFHWGQIQKLNKNSAISKVLISKLFDKGVELLKSSGQSVYKGSKYLLTQNVKGTLSIASPYNGLSYPLFAEDRSVGDSYLPSTYIYDSLLDEALWKTVHQYVNGMLTKCPQITYKDTEPSFYVVRRELRESLKQAGQSSEYTSFITRSSLEEQLQQAIVRHLFLTPLFNQDKSLGISKSLAPTLFNKGIEILQASQLSLVKNPSPYTLTRNLNGDLSSLCPWNGLVYPLFPDDRTNYKAFLPTTYVRDGYDTYLEQFFYKVAGDHLSGQEKSNMLHVFAPLPHVSRTAFKEIPAKRENFPSLQESAALLLEMAGDVLYGLPPKEMLTKAQKFFDKAIPFQKLNDDTLVHHHLTQSMLPRDLREERWELGDQYWQTINPMAQWGVIAHALEAVAETYKISGARLHGLIEVIEAAQQGGFEFVSMDKPERKRFLDYHVEEDFGRQVAEWVDYDADLMAVALKNLNDPLNLMGTEGAMGVFGGGRISQKPSKMVQHIWESRLNEIKKRYAKEAKNLKKEQKIKQFSKETNQLVGKSDFKYKSQLLNRPGKEKNQTSLRAAQKELNGEQLSLAKERGLIYDHVTKVEQAQRGLLGHIEKLNNRLSHPKLPSIERKALQEELSKASKLLDHTEQFVPRIKK